MSYEFQSRPEIEVGYNRGADLYLVVTDFEDEYIVHRKIITDVNEVGSGEFRLDLEIIDRLHTVQPVDLETKPAMGDWDDHTATMKVDKSDLEPTGARGGDPILDPMKAHLKRWHDNHPPDFSV